MLKGFLKGLFMIVAVCYLKMIEKCFNLLGCLFMKKGEGTVKNIVSAKEVCDQKNKNQYYEANYSVDVMCDGQHWAAEYLGGDLGIGKIYTVRFNRKRPKNIAFPHLLYNDLLKYAMSAGITNIIILIFVSVVLPFCNDGLITLLYLWLGVIAIAILNCLPYFILKDKNVFWYYFASGFSITPFFTVFIAYKMKDIQYVDNTKLYQKVINKEKYTDLICTTYDEPFDVLAECRKAINVKIDVKNRTYPEELYKLLHSLCKSVIDFDVTKVSGMYKERSVKERYINNDEYLEFRCKECDSVGRIISDDTFILLQLLTCRNKLRKAGFDVSLTFVCDECSSKMNKPVGKNIVFKFNFPVVGKNYTYRCAADEKALDVISTVTFFLNGLNSVDLLLEYSEITLDMNLTNPTETYLYNVVRLLFPSYKNLTVEEIMSECEKQINEHDGEEKTKKGISFKMLNMTKKQPDSEVSKELKKYKDLLDQGLISEEDYNAKKKQILNI